MTLSSAARRFLPLLTAASLVLAGATLLPSAAQADTAPPDADTPTTVSADSLPTVQINGVVWDQQVVGDTVYVVGKFTKARPAGSPAGTNEVTRNNMLAYNIKTGELVTGFAPDLNGEVLNIAASPDGSKVYIAGSFTTANGQTRYRAAAYSTSTGALDTNFRPTFDAQTRAVVATSSAVYYGGIFSKASNKASTRIAAVDPSTGVAKTAFTATAEQRVNALTMNPSGSKVIVGGAFREINGQSVWGIGAVDPATGESRTWNTNKSVTGYDSGSAFLSLDTDGDSVYGTAYNFYGPGNLEGAFRADGESGDLVWVEDCHGDTYSIHPSGGTVYTAGHPHYCGNIGGFPQSDPWSFYFATGFSKKATGVATANPYGGYYNFEGSPTPTLLNFFPRYTPGTFTGANQATWSVDGNSDYIVYGGEFTAVNGVAQQGLSRFAVRDKAPNKVGPNSNDGLTPTVVSLKPGTARVAWQATHDQDNTRLTYKVYRDGSSTPIYTTQQNSTFWQRPSMGFVDTGLTPGQRYRYQVTATDPLGNTASRGVTAIVIPTAAPNSAYSDAVLADGASRYYRFGEGGTKAVDWVGYDDATLGTGVTGAQDGATGDGNPASAFDGTAAGVAATPSAITAPNTFTTEAWVKTTSTKGGKVIGFGGSATGLSGNYDRHVYMDNQGRFIFGVYPGAVRTLTSAPGYNDGQYHQVVASMSSAGMALYVDGRRVGTRADTTAGQPFTGYWRIGGDNVGGWPNQPESAFLAGTIDDVAIYPTALTRAQVNDHWTKSGRASAISPAPADAYGAAVYADDPSVFWRLNESSGTTATDDGGERHDGTYYNGVRQGGSGITTATGTSGTFDGNDDTVSTNDAFDSPGAYSEEVWFKTLTNRGGKLMGFAGSQNGWSGNYDRHVYMTDDGRLTFGTWTGQANLAVSSASYNDGSWHHAVATQGADGMVLYVDGQAVGTNPQTSAQPYSGYWRIGGDSSWAGSSAYFAGSLDEFAVYPRALSAATVKAHYRAGGGRLPNELPTAAFTTSATKSTVSFDATTSTDPDGTLKSYSWSFGDGTTGTGPTTTHAYASTGSYQVTLTVTDDRDGTASVTRTVSATTNARPTAAFSSQVAQRKATFDATASTDSDGTVSSYAWDFGDNTTGTGSAPSHTYAAAGDYQVTLTVTDDDGSTGTLTKTVTIANAKPTAAFTGQVTKRVATFDATGSTDSDGTVKSYAWSFGDDTTGTGSAPSHTYAAAGSYQVSLTVTDDGGATDTLTRTVTVTANAAPKAAFGSQVNKRVATFDATGSTDSDGSVTSYAWSFGDDTTGTGSTPTHAYAAAGTYQVSLTVTDDDGSTDTLTKTVSVSANAAPKAAFSSTVSDLKATFDATGSTDSDGTVTSYSWAFGDNTTGTGSATDHTFASSGDYQVSLTVTDDDGSTDTLTKTVTVTAPPVDAPFAKDSFGRTTSNGWGTSDLGGAWTVASGAASRFSVANGTGSLNLHAAGASAGIFLNGVQKTSTDTQLEFSTDKVLTGSGMFLWLNGRGTAANGYRTRVKVGGDGTVQIAFSRTVSGAETVWRSTNVTGLTVGSGDTLVVRMQVSGTSPTTLRAKVWKKGTTEPTAWQVTDTDTTAALQVAGGLGVIAYLGGSATNAPVAVRFDNLTSK